MNSRLQATLVIVCMWAGVPQTGSNQYEPEAIAVVAAHQIKQMNFDPNQLVCLSLPNYKDPKSNLLKKINAHGLHLLPGSSCWKPPRGFLLLINPYERTSREDIELRMEVDDMNLEGAHVGSRLKEVTYRLRLDGGQWKIGAYQVTSHGAAQGTSGEPLNTQTPPSGWQRVQSDVFSIHAPPGWVFRKLPATDSYLGEFVGDGIVLRFDLGLFSSSLKEAQEPTYVIAHEVIGGFGAKIVSPRTPGQGVTGVYFSNLGASNSLCLFGENLTSAQQELVLRIFQTIRFGNPDLPR